jgi:uncharacterized protein YbjT (DUF2867 family)
MAPDRDEQGRSALVLGATGLVGGHCVDLLLAERTYGSVRVVGRRALARDHPKFEQHVLDLGRMRERPELFRVDDVFCCLGTTIRKAGSPEAFRQVDVEYPATAAALALDAGADQFLLVSSVGADATSRIFYNRSKGETEVGVRRLPFRAVWIVRPSLLLGKREEVRPLERLAEVILRPLTPLMRGPLERYRPVEASLVAAAMVTLALSEGTGGILESEELPALAAVSRVG